MQCNEFGVCSTDLSEHFSVCLETENYSIKRQMLVERTAEISNIIFLSGVTAAVCLQPLSCCQTGPEDGRNADVVF